MSEHKEPIPSMIYNASVGGHVTNSKQIIDENENKEQSQINAEVKQILGQGGSVDTRINKAKTDIIGDASSNGNTLKKIEDRVSPIELAVKFGGNIDSRIEAAVNVEKTRAEEKESTLDNKITIEKTRAEEVEGHLYKKIDALENVVITEDSINSKISKAVAKETTRAQNVESTLQINIDKEIVRAQTAEEQLRTLYNNLQQSNPIPITELPDIGEVGKIYRLAGTTSYSDYMWNGTQFIKMATYNNAIDNEPTNGSDNLVKSGGVAKKLTELGIYSQSQEYIRVITDLEDNILFGIKKDCSVEWAKGIPTPVKNALNDIYLLKVNKEEGKTLIAENIANIFELENNNEYIQAITDVDKKILFGIKKDGSVEWNKGVPIPIKLELNKKIDKENGKSLIDNNLIESFSIKSNKEYIKTIVDSEGHIIIGIRPDGTMQLSNNDIYQMSPTKEYLKVLVDKDNKVISYVDKNGVYHFNTTVVLDNIVYSNKIKKTLEEDLIKDGFRYGTDFSNDKLVELPIPSVCAKINILSKNMPTTKTDDFEGYIEYWDKEGNYFKKPIKSLNAQGSSSMVYWKKNYAFDLDDDSTIKFGNWVAQDSFHIKKYYIDCFRGQCVVGYRFAEQVFQSRGFGKVKPWDYLNTSTSLQSSGNINYDFNIGALAHPDGFPVMVYHNSELLGLYALCLKKHRDNYIMKKSNQSHILLDGVIGTDTFFGRAVNWTEFEVRNPKINKDINGNKYDGDNPTEPSDDFTLVKEHIRRLSYSMIDINKNPTKETFEKYFNVDYCIDYFLISQVLFNFDGFRKNWIWGTWDGKKWSPTIYDLDSIFGSYADGTGVYSNSTTTIVGIIDEMVPIENRKNNMLPSYWIWNLYKDELSLRYKELRDSGIFSTNNIISLLKDWVSACGYDNINTDLFECCAIDDIPQTPSYRDKSLTYSQIPQTGGFYNSIYRIKKWLTERFIYLDSQAIFNYNN